MAVYKSMSILTTYERSLRAQIIFAPAICVVCNDSIHAIEKRSPRARKTLSVKGNTKTGKIQKPRQNPVYTGLGT